MSVSSLKREEILKWHRSKAATPEYTAKLLGVPLDEVLYIIAHPETGLHPTRMISRPNSSNH